MSASREKKIRFEERAEGTEKRQVRAVDTRKAAKRKRIITTAAVAVVVVILVVAVVFNSTLFYTGLNAVKIGDWNLNATDVNYEYYSRFYNTYETIYETYGEYASLLLDPKTPLDKQQYSEEQTWAEFFEEGALSQLQQMAILNDMADKEGWSLGADQTAEINSTIDSLKTQAVNNGYNDYKAYLRALYGKGITEDTLRTHLRNSLRATYYSNELVERWKDSFSDAEKQAYYDDVRTDYNLLSYMFCYISGEADDENGIDADTALANAKAVADEVASASDADVFFEILSSIDPTATLENCTASYIDPSNLSGEAKTWLTDAEREYGDTKIISTGDGYNVLLFLESNDNRFNMVDFDAIVITVGTDEEGNINDTYLTKAKETVDEIQTAYEEDPTAENFSDLMALYNADTTIGGSHANVVPGRTGISEIDSFLFDEPHEEGDIGCIYKSGAFYIVRYAGTGEQYNLFIAENLMAQDQYAGMLESAEADYPIVKKFAYRFAM